MKRLKTPGFSQIYTTKYTTNPRARGVFSWQPSSCLQHLLKVSILVFAVGLQDDGDDSHERFNHTELQSGLLAKSQEANGVGLSPQTAGTVHTAGPDGVKHQGKGKHVEQ